MNQLSNRTNDVRAVVLAAGEGTRMKSNLPKVLHQVLGRPMIDFVVDALRGAGVERTGVVVGHMAEEIKKHLKKYSGLDFFLQEKQLGSAKALMSAGDYLDRNDMLLVLCADVPFIKAGTLINFVESHIKKGNSATVMTALAENPYGYGRIVKGEDGGILRIVEEKDADAEEKRIREINGGIYCFSNKNMKKYLSEVKPDNAKNEYYITDIVGVIVRSGGKVGSFVVCDSAEVAGINSQEQLREMEKVFASRKDKKYA